MLGEFLGAWLSNTVLVLLFALSSLYCWGLPLVFLLQVAGAHPKSRALLKRGGEKINAALPSMPSIPARYTAMVVLLGALCVGAFRASIPREPLVDPDPNIISGATKYSPLSYCISGFTPNEFRDEDKKMLRHLRFEWDESIANLGEEQLAREARRINFLEAEGEITPEEAKSRFSSYVSEMARRPGLLQEKREAACRKAASHLDSLSPPSVAPDEP